MRAQIIGLQHTHTYNFKNKVNLMWQIKEYSDWIIVGKNAYHVTSVRFHTNHTAL